MEIKAEGARDSKLKSPRRKQWNQNLKAQEKAILKVKGASGGDKS